MWCSYIFPGSIGGANPKIQIPGTKSNSKIQIPKPKIQIPGTKIPNSKFQNPNPKPQFPIPNSKFQIPNSKFPIPSQHQHYKSLKRLMIIFAGNSKKQCLK